MLSPALRHSPKYLPRASPRSSPRRPKWRLKLKLSTAVDGDVPRTPITPPRSVLSSSPFLTPLDVHDDLHFTPLTERKTVLLGDFSLPPPPPALRKKGSPHQTSGPKVRPFATSHMPRSLSDGAIASETCFICEELLETKLEAEKLVSLCCGDCVHGECLRTYVTCEFELASKRDLVGSHLLSVLPKCQGRSCREKGSTNDMDPVDQNLLTELIADAVLNVKLANVHLKLKRLASDPLPSRPRFPSWDASMSLNPAFDARESRSYSPALSMSTTKTTSVRIGIHADVPAEELKNLFIKRMLDVCRGFDLAQLVALGPLRLVDRLLVSTYDSKSYVDSNVYLFTHYVVIWNSNDTDPPTIVLLDNGYTQVETFPSVLKISSSAPNDTQSVWLHSETSSIIEKWGIAISDPLLVFPSDIITSTIPLSEVSQRPTWAKMFQKQVSPILELSIESSPSILVFPSPTIPLSAKILDEGYETELLEIGLQRSHGSSFCVSRPTTPLNIQRAPPSKYQDSDSDSDSDSDQEYIGEVMKSQRKR